MISKEKQDVMARLAASDNFSKNATEIAKHSDSDKQKACERVQEVFSLSAKESSRICENLIEHLENSYLSINFSALDLFEALNTEKFNGEITNGFQNSHKGDFKNIQLMGRDIYWVERNLIEENTFDYPGNRPSTIPENIKNRIKRYGSNPFYNVAFQPTLRPKYGILNFENGKPGTGNLTENYGQSCMILKDHVKGKCTFTPVDSMNEAFSDPLHMLATWTNLHRLITFMPERTLKRLHNATFQSNIALPPRSGFEKEYIEVQIHTEIMLNRDVKKIWVPLSPKNMLDICDHLNVSKAEVLTFFTEFRQISGIELLVF